MADIRELRSDSEIIAAFPLMSELRDRIQADTFLAEVRRQQAQGYELIGAFEGGRLVALAGVRRTHTLSRGEHLFVDDLITEARVRGGTRFSDDAMARGACGGGRPPADRSRQPDHRARFL
jgi:hypothetical protein